MNKIKIYILACLFCGTLFAQKRLLYCFTYKISDDQTYHGKWIKAKGSYGEKIYLIGKTIDGFFYSKKIVNQYGKNFENSYNQAKSFCLNSLNPKSNLIRIAIKERNIAYQPMDIVFNNNKGINQLIIFGDSMSDDGNLYHRIKILPKKPYFAGRFSNGPIWVDYLRGKLSIQNWAVGGSMTNFRLNEEYELYGGTTLITNTLRAFLSCNVQHEIKNYQKISLQNKKISHPESSLFVLWSGGNDYLMRLLTEENLDKTFDEKLLVTKTINNLGKNIRLLADMGAKNIAVLNLPDMGMLPLVVGDESYSSKFSKISLEHNQMLQEEVFSLKSEISNIDLLYVDIFSSVSQILALESNNYNLSITGEVCYSQTCKIKTVMKKGVFWDSIHPNTKAHELLSHVIFESFKERFQFNIS